MLDASCLTTTFEHADLPLGPVLRGKVRDAWRLPHDRRLIVTTDRISAFDRVLGTVPMKGRVLNLLSAWWFERLADLIPHHMLSVPHPHAMIVREATPLPLEVVVRGFITGVTSTSLWTLYQKGERPYGLELPPGLRKDDRLPQPVVTPTTKAQTGHDRPTTPADLIASGLITADLWRQIHDTALALFARGQAIAEDRGLLLVDTKYEFGLVDGRSGARSGYVDGRSGARSGYVDDRSGARSGYVDDRLTLIDEVHTPDSSRYWLADSWHRRTPEHPPVHLDKELLRQGLVALGYRGDGPPPPLPDALRLTLAERYLDLYTRLTGLTLPLEAPPLEILTAF